MTNFTISTYNELSPELLDTVAELDLRVFDSPITREIISERLALKEQVLALVAYSSRGEACGFKVGYEESPELFYSWIGGVILEHRNAGIARALMLEQHKALKELGFKTVKTHTKNKFRSMLILNLKLGFDVVDTVYRGEESELTIVLEKKL